MNRRKGYRQKPHKTFSVRKGQGIFMISLPRSVGDAALGLSFEFELLEDGFCYRLPKPKETPEWLKGRTLNA